MPRPLSRSGRGQSLSASAVISRRTSGAGPCAASATVGRAVGAEVGVALSVGDGGGTVGVALAITIVVAVRVGVEGRGVAEFWNGRRVLVGVTLGWPARAHPLVRMRDRQAMITSLRKMAFSL